MTRKPPKTLTAIIRDDSPLVCAGDSPTYRSVRLELTESQLAKLALRHVGTTGGEPIYESVSRVFLENVEEPAITAAEGNDDE